MKKISSLISSVLFCTLIFAQTVPQGINYQAVARDAAGNELINQSLTIQFSIISDVSAGTISWQETHSYYLCQKYFYNQRISFSWFQYGSLLNTFCHFHRS